MQKFNKKMLKGHKNETMYKKYKNITIKDNQLGINW